MAAPALIYHMTPRVHWEDAPPDRAFAAATLTTEGFIHCTAEPERLLQVANRFYRAAAGEWLILSVAAAQLTAPLRWEEADGHLFPHIYGPIDRQAIVAVTPFPRCGEKFVLPALWDAQAL